MLLIKIKLSHTIKKIFIGNFLFEKILDGAAHLSKWEFILNG